MASYVDNNSKLDWALMFQRTGKFPIDRSSMFSSYADAVKYAAGNASNPDSRGLQGSSYVGQIITVYENDTVNVYKINADRTLSAIGEGSGGIDIYETTATINSYPNKIAFSDEAYSYIKTNKPLIIKASVNVEDIDTDNYNIYLILSDVYQIDDFEAISYNTQTETGIVYITIRSDDTSSVGSLFESVNIGHIANLTTTAKSSIVAAINEINAKPSGGSSYDVTIESMTSSSLGNTVNFSSDSIPILEEQPGLINVSFPDLHSDSYSIFPLLFYKEDFILEGSVSTLSLNKLVYKSMPIVAYEEDDERHSEDLMISITFDLTSENPYSSASLEYNYPLGTNTVYANKSSRDSINYYINFSSESKNVLSKRPAFLSVKYSPFFEVLDTVFFYNYKENSETLIYKSTPYVLGDNRPYIFTLIFDLTSENPYLRAIQTYELYNEGSTVIANPTLVGTEDNLTGLEVDGTKYKIPQGGGVSAYADLPDKPSINNVTLSGDKTSADLSLASSSDITTINSKIPSQASNVNQLADKAFVNSSISTATATFRGTYTNLNTLQAVEGDKNDYAFYSHTDSAGNTIYDRYKYVGIPPSILPEGYTEVDSVNCTGDSGYINTEIIPSATLVIETALNSSYFNGYNYIYFMGSDYYTVHNNQFLRAMRISRGDGGNYRVTTELFENDKKNTLKIDQSEVYVNGTRIGSANFENTPVNPLYLFTNIKNDGTFDASYATANKNIYRTTFTNNNEVIADMVPCYRDVDYKVGFYDIVRNKFYTNDKNENNFGYTVLSVDKWEYEYSLNNSSFTAEQWATINSELTSQVTSTGYDATKTQVLKNINGTLTWVDET